ncbi:hypothetical protein ELH84_15815 [Rhizobium ruizarguesonis]|nr:hypothetical protein ELH84_15815 [Rhizobium ruizarguesonis]
MSAPPLELAGIDRIDRSKAVPSAPPFFLSSTRLTERLPFDKAVRHPPPPSSLCLSQGSSAPKSLGAGNSLQARIESFTAQTRGGWIPVTGTGMRVGRRRVALSEACVAGEITCS